MLSLVRSRTATSAASSAFPSCSTTSTTWVKTQPADRDPMHPDTTGLEITNIEMEPGDLMIFNSLLAHGVRPNHSRQPGAHGAVHLDVPGRRGRRRPSAPSASGCGANSTTRSATPSPAIRASGRSTTPRAKLTPLGEKLLGLERWVADSCSSPAHGRGPHTVAQGNLQPRRPTPQALRQLGDWDDA